MAIAGWLTFPVATIVSVQLDFQSEEYPANRNKLSVRVMSNFIIVKGLDL
jgi:hypothetical protein